MEIVPNKNRNSRRILRARRGAALMYALLVVFILSLILLAMGGLVTSHFKEEENVATYSHLIYSAEAAANWQLLQVSRTVPNLPDGSTPSNPGAGFQTLSSLTLSKPDSKVYTNINGDLGGIQIKDNVQSWVTDTEGHTWNPPNDCVIYAIASDPLHPEVRRGISFTATGTKLADRFTIFGRDSVTFSASSPQFCSVQRGFVGSNGSISYTADPPRHTPNTLGGFRGCLLMGPQAVLENPSGWPANLDYPQLPDPAVLPTIDQIISYTLPGTDINTLKTNPITRNNQGPRAQIIYDTRDGSDKTANGLGAYPYPAIGAMVSMNYRAGVNTLNSLQFKPVTGPGNRPVTSLGPNEFNQATIPDESKTVDPKYYYPPPPMVGGKPLHIIRLHAYLSDVDAPSDQDPNIFYFSNIQMRDNDVLLLDVRQVDPGRNGKPTACRIVIHNSGLTGPVHITNVAVVQTTLADFQHRDKESPGDSSFIFYNDTNQPLIFHPNLTLPNTGNAFYDSTIDPLAYETLADGKKGTVATDYPSVTYTLTPGCPGLAYGIRSANTGLPGGVNDLGGSVEIDGRDIPCTVVGAIANKVTLLGNVTVGQTVIHYIGDGSHHDGNDVPRTITRGLVVEAPDDPFRYAYFYRVTSSYQDINTNDLTTSAPAFGYGGIPQ